MTIGWDRNLALVRKAFSGLTGMLDNQPMVRQGTEILGSADLAPITWNRSISLTSAFSRFGVWLDGGGLAIGYGLLAALILAAVFYAAILYRSHGMSIFGYYPEGEGYSRAGLLFADWSLVIAFILIFSPQTTGRHYILALPTLIFALHVAVEDYRERRGCAVLVGLSFFLLFLFVTRVRRRSSHRVP